MELFDWIARQHPIVGSIFEQEKVPAKKPPEKESVHVPTFKIGDVVRLNSGSPSMTVVDTRDSIGQPLIAVEWWNGLAMNSHSFPPECLSCCGNERSRRTDARIIPE